MLCLASAWTGHTDDSRGMAEDFTTARKTLGMKEQEAADLMGLTLPQLSRQLAGREPLNLFRMAALPDVFRETWHALQADRLGGAYLSAKQRAYLTGAAKLGARRMLKAGLTFIADQKRETA